jgi:molecular chaperone DnaJ
MAQNDWMDKDFYSVLGVSKEAPKDDIKRAYRKLAQKYHPDANKGDKDAEQRFKGISEAHSVLSNDDKRREYDQMRAFVDAGGQRFYGFRPGAGQGNVRINVEDIEDLFGGRAGDAGGGGLFEDLFGFGARGRQRQGRDIETEITLDFEDAVGGDLYVRVHVRPHELFELGGDGDLVVRLPLTIAEAALGAKIKVPTLDEPVTVRVPAGSNSGKTLRLRGRGAPRQGGGTGDLLVRIEVEVPAKLSRDEKRLLEEFRASHRDSPRKHMESWLRKNSGRKVS